MAFNSAKLITFLKIPPWATDLYLAVVVHLGLDFSMAHIGFLYTATLCLLKGIVTVFYSLTLTLIIEDRSPEALLLADSSLGRLC